jgi:hypothetical protein
VLGWSGQMEINKVPNVEREVENAYVQGRPSPSSGWPGQGAP